MSYDGSTDGAGAQTVWEIAVSVGEDQLELTSDLLWSLGATAVEERPTSPGAVLVVTMSDRAAAEHFLRSLLAPTTGVEPSTVKEPWAGVVPRPWFQVSDMVEPVRST